MPEHLYELSTLASTCRQSMKESADIIMGMRDSFTVEYKDADKKDPYTSADIASSKNNHAKFAKQIDDGSIWYDEENKKRPPVDDVFDNPHKLWLVVDPIDGTKQFMGAGPSFGPMQTLYKSGRPFRSNIVMPLMGSKRYALELEVSSYDEPSASYTDDYGRWNPAVSTIRGAQGSHTSISYRTAHLRKLAEERGFVNVAAYSAAEQTINLARGDVCIISMSVNYSWWDVAPVLHLAEVMGYDAFYEDEPGKLITFGRHLFTREGKLSRGIGITGRAIRENLAMALAA